MGVDGEPAADRPTWATRLRAERVARGWSQSDAVRALRAHADRPLPGHGSLIRNWKRWEAGEVTPDGFYQALIARTFGTVTAAFFPRPPRQDADDPLSSASGMDTLELLTRIRASDVSPATLDALRVMADRLCCEYPYLQAGQLRAEGHTWLRRITSLLGRRLTLAQHREVLALAAQVALLLACVEYDLGQRRDAHATRQAALTLGEESGRADLAAWAHEIRAWQALTQGDHPGAVAAAEAGEAVAGKHSVAVQLAAQKAKAWARLGDRRQVEAALERGRVLLEALPYPDDPDHHFVVDPTKFDFYAMDCYRLLRQDRLAEVYANAVLRSSADPSGTVRKPMRSAEARVTLGVVAARSGDLEQAVWQGREAIVHSRKSLPSLRMCLRELGDVLSERYPSDPRSAALRDHLRAAFGGGQG